MLDVLTYQFDLLSKPVDPKKLSNSTMSKNTAGGKCTKLFYTILYNKRIISEILRQIFRAIWQCAKFIRKRNNGYVFFL